MKTEYRLIYTATFDTKEERDKAASALKVNAETSLTTAAMAGGKEGMAICKRADIMRDEYLVAENTTVSEKVI